MRRLILFALIIAAGAFAFLWYGSRAKQTVDVVIAPGSSLTAAARTLEKSGAVDSADRLLLVAKLFGPGESIRPGEYRIVKGMSSNAILALLQSGKVVQRFVAVPEGLPSILVAERINAAPALAGTVAAPPEGSILPDNYAYTRGETRSIVLARMQKAMQTAIANAWKARKPSTAATSPAQAINLAAIVEKETGIPSERRMVAAVYTNRLKLGMPLQADPTLIYPVTKGKPLGRRILRSEINADSAYNTYRRAGLPPGPITNPGLASIRAVLDPAPSKALYFVAKGDGSSVFAVTLAEHNANVARYYALRRSRGEM
ncbi:Endolytic murein transglycosylase [Sphingomonas antarctica]|uniref:endolytic transglycosylase MltG n=1 Tax=Sphingomonas antarctica TaxID=2040274 RepID=UPI0039E8B8CC